LIYCYFFFFFWQIRCYRGNKIEEKKIERVVPYFLFAAGRFRDKEKELLCFCYWPRDSERVGSCCKIEEDREKAREFCKT
jgi:hypothetical protein